ncbi:DUF4870 domain-containing protein [Flavobacterium soli]|uniref:DUF4870 domain-containing protein n=1 Tax=Flavobacterium soli TaxID=344881 RepID=UPI000401082D|nr:DUF4870 domain-containing protein [Flavobacterium soli]
METNNSKTTATLIHLSALSQYFIPFGNFIFPIIIWSSSKDKSTYIDAQGKQSINFNLSLLMYSFLMALVAVPLFFVSVFSKAKYVNVNHGDFFIEDFNMTEISGLLVTAIVIICLFILLKILEFFLIIYAAVKTSNGYDYKYPLTINFLK